MITRTIPAVGHAASVLASLANALGLPCVLASALVRPIRFSIVNPDSLNWGQSDWFIPLTDSSHGPDLWRAKASGLVYARCELAPSRPFWRSAERAKAYDDAPTLEDRVGQPLRLVSLDPVDGVQVLAFRA
jgi:hypothetical protein